MVFGLQNKYLALFLLASQLLLSVEGFLPSRSTHHLSSAPVQDRLNSLVSLEAAGGKKRRRRRKNPPKPVASEASIDLENQGAEAQTVPIVSENQISEAVDEDDINVADIVDVAKFNFEGQIEVENDPQPVDLTEENAIPLPDIKEALKKKKMEAELAKIEEEKEEDKVKIKRTDKKALLKLLEQQPYADADDSFFEEEEYGTVSALLGERAAPFLGIPSGPLQVGHFIGSLVIILMAFVEYPGFPLTNLPSPLRGALQGGLGTIYAINLVLAVLAVFKAGERGQPAGLWVAKTFSVGGLAYDQLTQLPTLEQIEKAKARKGARALKNRRR